MYFPYRHRITKSISCQSFVFPSFLSFYYSFFPSCNFPPHSPPPAFCCKVTKLHSESITKITHPVDFFFGEQLMSVTNKWDLELMSSSVATAWPFSGSGKPYFPRLALWWWDLSTAALPTKGDEWILSLETEKYIIFTCLTSRVVFPCCCVALFLQRGERGQWSSCLKSWCLLSSFSSS